MSDREATQTPKPSEERGQLPPLLVPGWYALQVGSKKIGRVGSIWGMWKLAMALSL